MIIGLVGRKGAGKTTVAELLKTKGFEEITFAEPLKRITSIIYGFDYDMLKGDTPQKREIRSTVRDPVWNLTGVEALQFMGTDVMRNNFDKDVWVKIATNTMKTAITGGKNLVITDVRFPNEMELIRSLGGKLWVLYEDIEDLIVYEGEGIRGHESENSFQNNLSSDDLMIENQKDGIDKFHVIIESLL